MDYKCSNCGATMSVPLDRCPKCGVLLSGVKCQACQYVGSKTEFINNNNLCPKCGSILQISGMGLPTSGGIKWIGLLRFLIALGAILAIVLLTTQPWRKPVAPTTPAVSIRVPPNYSPSIVIPICDTALNDGKITSNTYLCMVSDTEDYVGSGKIWIYNLTDATFQVAIGHGSQEGVWVDVESPDVTWNLQFNGPTSQQFVAGGYENVDRSSFSPLAGLAVSGDGNGCNTITGKFEILELEYFENNHSITVEGFSANFEQHCEGQAPALRGYIRFFPSTNTP